MRLHVLAPLALLCLFPVVASAEPIKDPAEVMPARTLAYLELRQFGQLYKEFASLFEGSYLGNMPDSLHKLYERHQKDLPPRSEERRVGKEGRTTLTTTDGNKII